MIGITVSAIMAATISHLAASYNILAALATRDVYRPLVAPNAGEVHLMRVGKISNLFFAVAAIFIGMALAGHKDAFQTTFIIASHTVIAMSFALTAGIVIRRVPWWSGAAAVIACFVTTLSIEFVTPLLAEKSSAAVWQHIMSHLFEYKVFGAIAVNGLVFAISMLVYKPGINDAPRAGELFEMLKKPIAQDKGAELFVPDLKVYKIVGYTLAPFGVPLIAISAFNITPDPAHVNMIIGVMFVVLAAMILWLVNEKYSPIKLVREQGQILQNKDREPVSSRAK
jgi:Na+/proline symporter